MQFNIEFIITLLLSLFSTYLVNTGSSKINPFITFMLIPLIVAYVSVAFINKTWPGINAWGKRVYNYGENIALDNINNTGYIQLFPPVFIVLIIFTLMLYNRILG